MNIKKKPRSGHHEVAVLVNYLEEKEFGALFFFLEEGRKSRYDAKLRNEPIPQR